MKKSIDAPKPADIPALRSLWKEAFGDTDAFLDTFARTAYSPARCRCVTVDGDVAAALYWFDCTHADRRIAYLYAVATARAHRGQGLCRALMEDTHRHLTEQGYAGAMLVPGSASLFDFYARMGYRTCTAVREITCTASPSDGRAPTAVLRPMSTFYAGDGFLLAARTEGNTVRGIELLGDTTAAPHIVRALGCETGTFRTPGNENPFAMFFPLQDGVPAPAYFGLAFD